MTGHPHRMSALARVVCRGMGLGTLTAVLVLTVSRGQLPATADTAVRPAPPAPAYAAIVGRALTELNCSTGSLSDQVPSSALVRTERGSVKVVSFEQGWAVYRGERPGTLVAVCQEDRAAARRALHRPRLA